jgi:hypothetical protein
MQMNRGLSLSVGLLTLVTITAISLAFPALAAPPAQSDILPTPTVFPIDNVEYTFMSYGGTDEPQIFTHAPVDGFTFTDTVVKTLYPAGMTFSVGVTSEHGEIETVQWILRREDVFGTRASAEWDAEQQQWVAHPWADGGQAAGTEGYFHWQVTDSAGNMVETEPQFVIYWDPENVWYRVESDYIVMHWYGIGDDPEAFGRGMAEYMAALHPRFVAGFGRGLSYKPLALIYPDRESYATRFIGGIIRANQGGVTVPGEGLTTQRLRAAPIGPTVSECLWSKPADFWTLERRIQEVYSTVAHEVTHLYQGDVLGGTRGPTWWSEGQAEWFSNGTPDYADERLHNLSSLQEMPTLQGEVGYQTNEADGCFRLAYDAGASFVNWLLANYGGIDTHHKIAELQYNNVGLYDAIEEATGKPFIEIENEWRAYHGFRAITPAELDPSLALQTYDDPMIAVDAEITLPAVPAMSMLTKDPTPNAEVIGSCWANTKIKILQIGQLDEVVYVRVDCMGQVGWMTRDQIIAPGE